MAVQGRIQYGGKLRYDDDPARIYRYDSTVPNSRWVSSGDLVLLRDRKVLLGAGRVERIESGSGSRKRRRCPVCNIATIKERRVASPKWRCRRGHTFAEAREDEITVDLYEAHYGSTFLPANDQISAAEIRKVAMGRSDQQSIRELEPGKLEGLLMKSFPESEALLTEFIQSISVVADDADVTVDSTGKYQFTPSFSDDRTRVLRAIKERRGQASFRKKLKKRYEGKCVVSGCDLFDVLEAAHIWPYRGPKDNHPGNGLLLRADLHTLFDLDLLGIHPDTLCVSIAKKAKRSDYVTFDGARLDVGPSGMPSRAALEERWAVFLRREKDRNSSENE